jgi:hypothetical protein
MKMKINKEAYEALSDALKEVYLADGEDFKLILEDAPKDLSTDVEKLMKSLKAEREDHKNDKKSLKEFIEKLESKINPDKDETPKVENSNDPNILALQKQLEKQNSQLETILKEKENLQADNKSKSIIDKLKKLSNGKIIPSAVDDLIMYKNKFDLTEDGKLVTKDGTTANDWFVETLKSKQHWIPKSVPAGASGGSNISSSNTSNEKRYKELMAKESLDLRDQAEAMGLAKEIKASQEA